MKGYSDFSFKYRRKALNRQMEILNKGHLEDSDKLEYMMLGIHPYSSYWNMGMIRALKKAVKLLRKEESNNDRTRKD